MLSSISCPVGSVFIWKAAICSIAANQHYKSTSIQFCMKIQCLKKDLNQKNVCQRHLAHFSNVLYDTYLTEQSDFLEIHSFDFLRVHPQLFSLNSMWHIMTIFMVPYKESNTCDDLSIVIEIVGIEHYSSLEIIW